MTCWILCNVRHSYKAHKGNATAPLCVFMGDETDKNILLLVRKKSEDSHVLIRHIC